MGLLSLAIWTPIAFGVVLLALGRDEQVQMVRWIALFGAVASFVLWYMNLVGLGVLPGALSALTIE